MGKTKKQSPRKDDAPARAAAARPASPHDGYVSALSGRYASPEMQSIWSSRRKFETWRRIWLAVAEAQQACGLAITDAQIKELRDHLEVSDVDIARAEKHERELRHDVMAHVHAWGDVCRKARPIIHLGMTSQDINDNAELLLIDESLAYVAEKLGRLVSSIGAFAERWEALPTLGLTHLQAAQPTTVGRRAAMWGMDLREGWEALDPLVGTLRLRGFRGATGTQASYLALFDGDADRVIEFEARAVWSLLQEDEQEALGTIDEMCSDRARTESIATSERSLRMIEEFGWKEHAASMVASIALARAESSGEFRRAALHAFLQGHTFVLTGQTYPRAGDAALLGGLGAVAAVLHKIATDIRLLAGRGEMDEPFGDAQVGSSAMPHKRNPMRCERVCGLARYVMNLVPNALDTAATQWLERTLDDSANRRLVLPEAFLALDGCLDLMRTVVDGLVVHEAIVRKNLDREMPYLACEHLLVQAVKAGRDRQDVHEAIRRHAQAAAEGVKRGQENDLIARLKKEPLLKGVDFSRALDPVAHIGLAREQVDEFLRAVVRPLRDSLGADGEGPTDRGV